jgi:hypothetical protein
MPVEEYKPHNFIPALFAPIHQSIYMYVLFPKFPPV